MTRRKVNGTKLLTCPYCGYIINSKLVEMSKFDFPCARCRARRYSEFVPYEDTKIPVEETK